MQLRRREGRQGAPHWPPRPPWVARARRGEMTPLCAGCPSPEPRDGFRVPPALLRRRRRLSDQGRHARSRDPPRSRRPSRLARIDRQPPSTSPSRKRDERLSAGADRRPDVQAAERSVSSSAIFAHCPASPLPRLATAPPRHDPAWGGSPADTSASGTVATALLTASAFKRRRHRT